MIVIVKNLIKKKIVMFFVFVNKFIFEIKRLCTYITEFIIGSLTIKVDENYQSAQFDQRVREYRRPA